eukprot:CAMPEP_0170323090 /NCGR_PEP_ID=MMETSP0116_2-20130129/62335_1 /TAXON_ID=400756 /ORGANISM="Durinskia baltica, Strain CSIRO CS-38" /LENGTH=432 /DNA_ID=CAMNT_0010575973 /DNA_START=130 /DNA_END=1429 /DNA_ORIENTATION=+
MAFVVKMCSEGDIRRVRFPSDAEVTVEAIRLNVRDAYGFSDFVATLADAEGERCLLTAATLQDALARCDELLRIEVTPLDGLPGASSPAPSVRAANAATQANVGSRDSPAAMSSRSSRSSPPALSEQAVEFPIHTPDPAAGSPRSPLAATPAGAPSGAGLRIVDDGASDSDAGGTDGGDANSSASTADPQAEDSSAHLPAAPDQAVGDAEQAEDASHGAASHSAEGVAAAPLADLDKIDIILAAFDADGDGRLSLEDFAQLRRTAGGDFNLASFAAACTELGADPARGLGAGGLAALYAAYGSLDRHFDAALARLQGSLAALPSAPAADEPLAQADAAATSARSSATAAPRRPAPAFAAARRGNPGQALFTAAPDHAATGMASAAPRTAAAASAAGARVMVAGVLESREVQDGNQRLPIRVTSAQEFLAASR